MNKNIIIKVFSNSILNIKIFENVHWIHTTVLKKDRDTIYKWHDLNEYPQVLAQLNYTDLIEKYYNSTTIQSNMNMSRELQELLLIFNEHRRYSKILHNYKKEMRKICCVIKEIFKSGNLNLLKYIMEEVLGTTHIDHFLMVVDESRHLFNFAAGTTQSLDIIEYLNKMRLEYPVRFEIWDISKRSLVESAASGKLEIFQWFEKKSPSAKLSESDITKMLKESAKVGSLEVFKYIVGKQSNIKSNAVKSIWINAIKSGNIDLLNYIQSLPNFSLSKFKDTIDSSVRYATKNIIEWLFEKEAYYTINGLMTGITERDSVEFIEWIYEFLKSIGKCDEQLYPCAIDWYCCLINNKKKDDSDYEEALSEEDCVDGNISQEKLSAMDIAINLNSIEIVKWLHYNTNQGCTLSTIEDSVSFSENIQLLEWLHQNRTERCTKEVMKSFYEMRAENQRFLVDYYPELMVDTIISECAIYDDGKDNLFEYIAKKYPQYIQPKSLVRAARNGNNDIFEFIFNQIFPTKKARISPNTQQLQCFETSLFEAIEYQNIGIVKFLCENLIDFSKSEVNPMEHAVITGNLDIIKYLHLNTVWKLDSNKYSIIENKDFIPYGEIRSLVTTNKKRSLEEETSSKKKLKRKIRN